MIESGDISTNTIPCRKVLSVWAAILRRSGAASGRAPELWAIGYRMDDVVGENLRAELRAHGVRGDQLTITPQMPWIDHVG